MGRGTSGAANGPRPLIDRNGQVVPCAALAGEGETSRHSSRFRPCRCKLPETPAPRRGILSNPDNLLGAEAGQARDRKR